MNYLLKVGFVFFAVSKICFGYTQEQEQQIRNVLKLNEPSIILSNEMSGYSFDPLDASLTKNLRHMRLLYETPIRFDKNGFMYSNILKKFSFKPDKKTLFFYLKEGLTYSDGSDLTIFDLSLAIKRILLSRPEHPAIDKIAGIKQWLKHSTPLEYLPEGMSIHNNVLKITYSEKVSQPLTWFSNEIFSIIPERCIDKKNSKITCTVPPFSGEYELIQSEVPFFSFKKRVQQKLKPEIIRFIHVSPVKIIKFLEDYMENHVIVTDEIYLPPDHRNIITNRFRQHFIPESRFMALSMNIHAPPFNDIRVRQFFAKEYRKTLETLFGRSDAGIFTRIMPGYISLEILNTKISSFSPEEEKRIIEVLKKNPPQWIALTVEGDHDPFQFYLTKTLNRLGIPLQAPTDTIKGADEYLNAWKSGKVTISRVYAGFGGPDPTEDLKTVFAKNMFYFLEDIYQDKYLQGLIKKINHTCIEELDQQNLKNINSHMFEQAIFAPVVNYTVAQYTLKTSPLNIINDYISDPSHYFMQ